MTDVERFIFDLAPYGEMKNSRVAITGNGLISRSIAAAFDFWNKDFGVNITCDVFTRSKGFLVERDRIPKEIDYNYIIHTACPIKTTLSQSSEFFNICSFGTRNAFINHPKAKHLHISSGAVAKPRLLDCIDDASLYSEGKRLSELAALQYSSNVKIARVFCPYGLYMDLNNGLAISNFIKAGINKTNLYVEGRNVRSYMHSADLVNWLITILVNGKKSVYDVGSFVPVEMLDVAKMISDNVTVSHNGKYSEYLPKNKAAIEELDLREYYNLHTGLRDVIKQLSLWKLISK
jgi:nucleoside-diphosphate-sugar epimerase